MIYASHEHKQGSPPPPVCCCFNLNRSFFLCHTHTHSTFIFGFKLKKQQKTTNTRRTRSDEPGSSHRTAEREGSVNLDKQEYKTHSVITAGR